jgi:flagellar motility protein MotE (MotC chaperone)
MSGGYEKFFQDARKASGLSKGTPSPKKEKAPQFQMKPEGRPMTPEDRVRAELTMRLKQKKQQALRKRQKFPLYPVACATAALIMSVAGFQNFDAFEQVFDRTIGRLEIGIFGQASAAGNSSGRSPANAGASAGATAAGPAKAAGPGGVQAEKSAGTLPVAKPVEPPNVKQWTAEELSFFSKLNERKQELDLREAELVKLEEELQKRKLELDQKLKQLESMRTEISQTLKSRVANDQEKVDKLVQFYSNMKPQQASVIIESLNEDLAVEVLDKMKKKNAADILNLMDAKKARRLSELLTGYQRTPSAAKAAIFDESSAQDAQDKERRAEN